MSSDLENIERLHKDILNIVSREVKALTKVTEGLDSGQVRSLAEYEKIVRSALEIFEKRPVKNNMTNLSTEELMRQLQEVEEDL